MHFLYRASWVLLIRAGVHCTCTSVHSAQNAQSHCHNLAQSNGRLQIAHYLAADTHAPAAAFCVALSVPADGRPDHVQRTAAALLAEQPESIKHAVAAVHAVLRDARRPLLTHKLAALPASAHPAACRHYVRSRGAAGVSESDEATLLAALQALRGMPEVKELSLGFDKVVTSEERYHGAGTTVQHPPRASQQAALFVAAEPHLAALSRLTRLQLCGISRAAA
jgi:hypothetical protein